MTIYFRFPSFPRKRESSNPLKRLDTRFHGYDDMPLMSESPVGITFEWIDFFVLHKSIKPERITGKIQ